MTPTKQKDSYLTALDLAPELSEDSITSLQKQIELARDSDNAAEFVARARQIKDVPYELAEWVSDRYNATGMLSIQKASEEFIQEVS